MEIITIFLLQFCLIAVGLLAAVVLGVKSKLEILGASYLLGSGLITLLFLLFHWWLKFDLDSFNFIFSLTISLITLFLAAYYTKRIDFLHSLFHWNIRKSWKKFSKIENILLLVILALIGYSFLENYFWPVTDWDALAFYDFRAQIITLRGSMEEGIQLGYFFQYPPYTSFLHAFGYLFGAMRVKVAYSFIYFSLLTLFYGLLRRKQDGVISAIATLVLASSSFIFEHSVTAYSNLPYTVFFSLGIIYLWLYIQDARKDDLLLGGILIGLSTWIRSTEPFWIVGLILLVWGFCKHRSNLFTSVLLAFWLSMPNRLWRQFLVYLDSLSPLSIGDTQTHSIIAIRDFIAQGEGFKILLQHIWQVSIYLVEILIPGFLLLFLIFIFTVFYNTQKKLPEIATLLFLFGVVWGGTFIFSFTFEQWNMIDGSIVRMCMIFVPLLIFLTARDLTYEKK